MKRALIVLVVLGALDALFVVAQRPDTKTDTAASAAMTAMGGDDPSAGDSAECDFDAGPALVIMRARYDCRFLSCGSVLTRLRVTHVLLGGGWSFRVTRGRPPYAAAEGDVEPLAAPHTSQAVCP